MHLEDFWRNAHLKLLLTPSVLEMHDRVIASFPFLFFFKYAMVSDWMKWDGRMKERVGKK